MNISNNKAADIANRYIISNNRNNFDDCTPKKNIQAEINKIESIIQAVRSKNVSDKELIRLKNKITNLNSLIDMILSK